MNIRGSNIKGREWSHELDPCVVLVGDNATGKSAILTGLRLSLTGCLPPPIGKANPAVWAATAGNPDADGELWAEARVGQHAGVYKLVSKKGRISGEWNCDHAITVPEMLVDPGSFFRQTANDQLQSILRVTGATAFNVAQLDALIEETTGTPIEVRTAWKEEARKTLSLCYAAPADLAGMFLAKAQGAVKEGKVFIKTRTERVRSLASSVANPAPRDVTAELAVLEAKEKALAEEMKGVVARREVWNARNRHYAELEKLRFRLVDAEAKKPAAGAPPEPAHNWERLDELVKVAERKVREAGENNSRVENQMDAIKTLSSEADATGLCPLCDCKVANALHFRQKLDVKLAALETNRTTPDELGELETAWGAALAKLQDAEEARQHWLAVKAEIERKVEASATLIANLKREIDSKSGMAFPSDEPPEFSALNDQLTETRSKIDALRGEARLRSAYAKSILDRDEAEVDLARTTANAGFWDNLAKRLAAKIEEASCSAFNALLTKTRLITDGLLASPLSFREGELGRYVSDEDKRLGSNAPVGAWVSHKSFSGTEELIAYAAFAVAVTDGAPYRLVLMDELGRIQGARRRKLVRRMGELVRAGTIHQFIGVDTAHV